VSKIKLADYVMDFLGKKGTGHVFLLSGGGAMHLNDALAKSEIIQWVPNHHEQAAAVAAEAYSRIDGHVGVCNVTAGPGGTNAVTAVAGAWIESVPLIVLSGQVKRADLKGDIPLRQKGTTEVDIVSIVKPITKYATIVTDPNQIRYHLEKAWHLATTGRRGPVWLDFPLDVQGTMIDVETLSGYEPEPKPENKDLAKQIEKLYELINASKYPLILAGNGIRMAGAAPLFQKFYESLNIPVVTSWLAMDLIPFAHPLHVGRPGVQALRAGNFAVQNCDLLVSVGARLENVVTGYNANKFARNAIKYLVDVDQNELNKFDPPLPHPVCADATEFFDAALKKLSLLKPNERKDWHERCQGWKKKYPAVIPKSSKGKISHFALIQALSDAIPADTLIVTGSAGMAVEIFYMTFQNKPGQRIFLTSGLGAMGYGLPAMIGAGLANGNKPFVGVESDGSLMLNIQELLTIKELNLPVRIFIMNNKGYSSIRTTQRNYFGRFVGTGPESKLFIGDVCAIAKAMGIEAVSCDDVDELENTIRFTMSRPGPIICDIALDPEEGLAPKLQSVTQADGTIVSPPLEDLTPLLPRSELRQNMIFPLDPASEKMDVPEKVETH